MILKVLQYNGTCLEQSLFKAATSPLWSLGHYCWTNPVQNDLLMAGTTGPMVALFPGLHLFRLHEEHGGPGILSYVCDVKGRKVVERKWVHWGSEQQEELRYQVTYHTYPAGKGAIVVG